jgi:glutaminyl-tRNA synthetase
MSSSSTRKQDFIRQIVTRDVASGLHAGRVLTRFPPEPNGFLHIGHAAAICLDFGVAEEFGGTTTLRMDDTNPTTEDPLYVEAIAEDIRWLGFEWEGEIRYASDYFEALYQLAIALTEDGHAYVDSQTEEEIRRHRGTVTAPGSPSSYRDRSVDENLDLFRRMRAGEFEDGAHVLRAKIDMASPNMKMRDPLLYRIRHAHHYRTGDEWPIYPMYDWAHGLSDAIEGITHSFCTLEFENNRELYDWGVEYTRPAAARIEDIPEARGGGGGEPGSWDPRPRQYEFARVNLAYTVMSKRKLLTLVNEGRVDGWNDPRMPTLAGMRRRGVTPAAIRAFAAQVGIAKADKRVDIETLESAVRADLNQVAPRVMCVMRPLRVVIENYPEGESEHLDAPYFPRDVEHPPAGWPETRGVPFSRTLYIEREDFSEDPPKGFRRLAPDREVRLRYAYFITCNEVVKDPATGEVVELHCTYDPATRGGNAPDGRKVSGTIHWVSAEESIPIEARLYDRLFSDPDPEGGVEDFHDNLNPSSLEVLTGSRAEPSAADAPPGTNYQFERVGYFVLDPGRGEEARRVFNRTVTLRDTWGRRQAERAGEGRGRAGRRAAESYDSAEPTESTAGPAPTAPSRSVRSKRFSRSGADARERSPELREKFQRFQAEHGLAEDAANLLTRDPASAALFERALTEEVSASAVANWIIHELRGVLGGRAPQELPFGGEELGALVALVEGGEISQPVAKRVLERMLEEGGNPREIVEEEGLGRISDASALTSVVEGLLEAHREEAARYRAGQEGLIGFFVGQGMRETSGRADPEVLKRLLLERLRHSLP